jgi:hypothetical protein
VQPDVVFFLSGTGDPSSHREFRNLETITLSVDSHYHYKLDDHRSKVHPVADLFALACCPVLLATPVSGFSHWAANALGPPGDCILPLPGATRDDPRRTLVRLYGARLPRWRATSRNGAESQPLPSDFSGLDLGRPADASWL